MQTKIVKSISIKWVGEVSLGFYELFGQIGATVVSIIFSLFVGYLLYTKEQRDRIGNKIIELKRKMSGLVNQLCETPIPGVMQSLVSHPEKDEEWNKLSITEWAAGVSWDMRAQAEGMKTHDIWDRVRAGLENLVKGVLPDGYFPEIRVDSESFREWAENFIEKTEHIEWFCHEYAGYSWVNSLIEKMRAWEREHPNPVLKSQDVALLLHRIVLLRRLVYENLLLEQNYQNLKIENAVSHYKIIIAGFLVMAISSIATPLIMLLLPPFTDELL